MNESGKKSFVLFPLGKKRFALPAEKVTELARPDNIQTFPHRTRLVTGVLVRRGHIVPVYDVAQTLLEGDAPPRKFYLIANRQFEGRIEWTAIPVTGECELSGGELQLSEHTLPDHVSGELAIGNEIVEVLNLEKLIAREEAV